MEFGDSRVRKITRKASITDCKIAEDKSCPRMILFRLKFDLLMEYELFYA